MPKNIIFVLLSLGIVDDQSSKLLFAVVKFVVHVWFGLVFYLMLRSLYTYTCESKTSERELMSNDRLWDSEPVLVPSEPQIFAGKKNIACLYFPFILKLLNVG